AAVAYGDELMLLSNQARPYEKHPGSTDQLLGEWTQRIADLFQEGKGYGLRQVKRMMVEIAASFASLPLIPSHKTKVGIVGEIYIKYASLGNNNLEAFLQRQDCEYRIPGVMSFALFSVDNRLEDRRLYGGRFWVSRVARILTWYLTLFETALIRAVQPTHFSPPAPFAHVRELVSGVISHGSKMGEGWLLTAEMLELAEQGYENIICTQPFGCLPNHINGRGMMNRVKAVAPHANIVAIDYDPSAAPVNQENRIKLMLASARGERPAGAQACAVPPESFEAAEEDAIASLQTADQSAWT
ncbi:MAG TPA: 2-hydroxyglutaryl-CoA dehydratase, partial [Clostridia bacterium]|nr:2-hydroxyglutaryl-CoA dehydratase [Clostridia bacterium]